MRCTWIKVSLRSVCAILARILKQTCTDIEAMRTDLNVMHTDRTVEEPFILKFESDGAFYAFNKGSNEYFYKFRMSFNIKNNKIVKFVSF